MFASPDWDAAKYAAAPKGATHAAQEQKRTKRVGLRRHDRDSSGTGSATFTNDPWPSRRGKSIAVQEQSKVDWLRADVLPRCL